MAQTAAHFVEHVIPRVPVTLVLQVVHRLITRQLLEQAGIKAGQAEGGAVTLIRRFGSVANLKVQPQYPRYASD